ncbi:uncharacterized protein LOC143018378 [Oratosquilla oratoria]|uniref:uncharacterized protein LOC143018378 n=1 Tax=Oratosquilla oratoria TaxID=337810 RepID=UPI003F7702E3
MLLELDGRTANVEVGLAEIPVKGIDVSIGNDVGEAVPIRLKTVNDPIPRLTPTQNDGADMADPVAFITRSQAKKAREGEERRRSNLDPLLGSVYEDAPPEEPQREDEKGVRLTTDESVAENQGEDTLADEVIHGMAVDKKELIRLQQEDPGLEGTHRAVGEEDQEKGKYNEREFVTEDGIILRRYKTRYKTPDKVGGDVVLQVVVPQVMRKRIIKVAHELTCSHLGISKTKQAISAHFFWPRMSEDIKELVKQCVVCQVAGKPNDTPKRAPMCQVLIIEEPFSKLVVDCVGPLPKTKSGKSFLLTIMCQATRYAEAIPLSNIKARTITKALMSYFSKMGMPREVQSDRGTNFLSGIFKGALESFDIKHVVASAYHPQSQGSLERSHGTLKRMIRAFILEFEKDWDEGIDLLLYASRITTHEGLGFSPFYLMFGRTPREPLATLYDQLLSKTSEDSTKYARLVGTNFEKLKKIRQIAKRNLERAQGNYKGYYDRKSIKRELKVGEYVLVLSPQKSSLHPKSDTSEAVEKSLSSLKGEMREEVRALLKENTQIFSSCPTVTQAIHHDVVLEDGAKPVRQTPYRLSPQKKRIMEKEMRQLLDQGLVEPGTSPWASPACCIGTKTRRIDDLIEEVAAAKYLSELDLTKGYHQIPLTSRASEISAFVTPQGHFQYKVTPFGMKNSGASFQRLVNWLVEGLPGVRAYSDDIIVFSDNWDDHLHRLKELFDRLTHHHMVGEKRK